MMKKNTFATLIIGMMLTSATCIYAQDITVAKADDYVTANSKEYIYKNVDENEILSPCIKINENAGELVLTAGVSDEAPNYMAMTDFKSGSSSKYTDVRFVMADNTEINVRCMNPLVSDYGYRVRVQYVINLCACQCAKYASDKKHSTNTTLYYARLFSMKDIKTITFSNNATFTYQITAVRTAPLFRNMFKSAIRDLGNKSWWKEFH